MRMAIELPGRAQVYNVTADPLETAELPAEQGGEQSVLAGRLRRWKAETNAAVGPGTNHLSAALGLWRHGVQPAVSR